MKLLFIAVTLIFFTACESMSVTHKIPQNYRPLNKVGIVFNSSNDVCLFGKKYSDLLDHRKIVVDTSISLLESLGLQAQEIDIRDFGADDKVLTTRLWRSNTAQILEENYTAYQKLMADVDLLLVMEHNSLTGKGMQGDCLGAISITPRSGQTQYGTFTQTNARNMAYAPPIMWIFKREQYKSRGTGVYLHRNKGVPFPIANPEGENAINKFILFYQEMIKSELTKAFVNIDTADGS